MNILLLGSGGREHALALKLSSSPLLNQLYIAPGNGGTQGIGLNLPFAATDTTAIKQALLDYDIQMLLIGPEEPLVNGVVDEIEADGRFAKVLLIGPNKAAARMEGSKAFSKAFMQRHGIPTARYATFNQAEYNEAIAFMDSLSPPYVLKADGLAAGKGVLILNDRAEAERELKAILEGKFGAAGRQVLIEEYLSGIEFSVFALSDGVSFQLLPEAKDYKRIGEGDTGLNTGGMGSVSPVPFFEGMREAVMKQVIKPTFSGLAQEGMSYVGFLFFGMMAVQGKPYVIEYNCRLGDPETQSVMARLDSDLVELLQAVGEKKLHEVSLNSSPLCAATVVLAAGGYPEHYEKGKLITSGELPPNTTLLHAGTSLQGGKLLTHGGRVLGVTATAETLAAALEKCIAGAEAVDFEGKYFRRDIGYEFL